MNPVLQRAFALVLVASVSSSAPALAESVVTGVTVNEVADATEIRIRGLENPSYSVYRLHNPLRLFIDVADSSLGYSGDALSVDNGVVGQVAAAQYNDELTTVTRIVIGFDQEAAYDVVSDGGELLVTIDGAERRPFIGANPDGAEDLALLRDALLGSEERVAALEEAVQAAAGRAEQAEAALLAAHLERARTERGRLAALASNYDIASQVGGLEAELGSARQAQAAQERVIAEQRRALSELQAAAPSAAAELNAARETQAAQEQLIAEQRQALSELQSAAPAAEAELAAARRAQAEQERLIAEQQQALSELRAASTVVAAGGEIRDIRFENDGEMSRVVIEVPPGVEFATLPHSEGRSTIVFSNATLPDRLRRTLDTQAFNGPVAFVSSYTDSAGNVRVVAELGQSAAEMVRNESGRLIWEFSETAEVAASNMGFSSLPNSSGDTFISAPTSYGSTVSPYAVASGNASTSDSPFLERPRMTRKRITIDLREADIQNVLRLIADEGNINIVTGAGVRGTITLRLRSVPLDDALVVILRSQGLGWEQQGNIIRIAPIGEFEERYNREIEMLRNAWELDPLRVRLIPVNYADASSISTLVSGVLSSRGRVDVDARNNALIVTDVVSHLDTAEQIVSRVDTQTPQILIEARIVETNDQFRRQLGIQWGGSFVADQSLGNATGLLFPSTIGIGGGASDGQEPTAGTSGAPNFAVNLPAPAGTGSGGAIGFTFGSLSGALNLNVRLSAAEDSGTAKVVSAPRIMTLDNESASITSGVSIPVSVVSAAGAQTVFFDASLTLNVTPRVTPDGNVFLTVDITKNEPDFENTGARGDPSIIRREARTQLLVGDGDTTVIGGIFQRNSGYSQSRVPFFGNLPVLGPLFRSSSQTDVRNELLVFITPRIVNRDLSINSLTGGPQIDTIQR